MFNRQNSGQLVFIMPKMFKIDTLVTHRNIFRSLHKCELLDHSLLFRRSLKSPTNIRFFNQLCKNILLDVFSLLRATCYLQSSLPSVVEQFDYSSTSSVRESSVLYLPVAPRRFVVVGVLVLPYLHLLRAGGLPGS